MDSSCGQCGRSDPHEDLEGFSGDAYDTVLPHRWNGPGTLETFTFEQAEGMKPSEPETAEPTPISRQQRRAMERAAAAQAEADAALAAKLAQNSGSRAQREKAAIDNEFGKMLAHPSAEEEQHEGAAFLNMQGEMPTLVNNVRMAAMNEKRGRHFLLSFPRDMDEAELLETVTWLLTDFRRELQRRHAAGEAKPVSPIEIARSLPQAKH